MFTTVSEFKAWLNQILATNGSSHLDSARPVVKFLGQKSQLCSLLKLILSDSEQLAQAASQSYVHYNGFDKIVLLSSKYPQYKLRLHVWWPNPDLSVTTENIHNHRWDFSSIILVGSYM